MDIKEFRTELDTRMNRYRELAKSTSDVEVANYYRGLIDGFATSAILADRMSKTE